MVAIHLKQICGDIQYTGSKAFGVVLPCSIGCGFHMTSAISSRLKLTHEEIADNTITNRTTGLLWIRHGARMPSLRFLTGASTAHRHGLPRFIAGVLAMTSLSVMAASGSPTDLQSDRSCCNLVEL